MGLSINPLDIFKFLREKRGMDRQLAANYLDSIAEEATELATVWERAAKALMKGSIKINDKLYEQMLEEMDSCNTQPYERLANFYQNISTAIAGRMIQEDRENYIFHLASLLRQREITKSLYLNIFSNLKHIIFFDDTNHVEDFTDLKRSIEILHKEAAALNVLAKTFRVSGK